MEKANISSLCSFESSFQDLSLKKTKVTKKIVLKIPKFSLVDVKELKLNTVRSAFTNHVKFVLILSFLLKHLGKYGCMNKNIIPTLISLKFKEPVRIRFLKI